MAGKEGLMLKCGLFDFQDNFDCIYKGIRIEYRILGKEVK